MGLKQYEIYRIHERKYSSNIIEGGYIVNGEMKYDKIIAPLLSKNEGDILCEKIFNFLLEEN